MDVLRWSFELLIETQSGLEKNKKYVTIGLRKKVSVLCVLFVLTTIPVYNDAYIPNSLRQS